MLDRAEFSRFLRLGILMSVVACDGASSGSDEGGDETACPDIGCGSPFQINFEHPGPWRAGTYVFALNVDGEAFECSANLPFTSCDAPVLPDECDGRLGWYVIRSGCALAPEQHSLPAIEFFSGTPARVELAVFRDGVSLGQGQFTPVYSPSQVGCTTCVGAPAVALPLAGR